MDEIRATPHDAVVTLVCPVCSQTVEVKEGTQAWCQGWRKNHRLREMKMAMSAVSKSEPPRSHR